MSLSTEHLREVFHQTPAATAGRRQFWRSVDELNQSPEFIERLKLEFPDAVSEWVVDQSQDIDATDAIVSADSTDANSASDLSRRNFLTVMGAGLALLGMNGCSTRKPDQQIVPYVNQPEFVVPGRPLFYATALSVNGYAYGALVESHEGRPTKIEGNPGHPASLGATNVFMQASVLDMYDPDRSQVVTQMGSISTWDKFIVQITGLLAAKQATRGRGLRVLSEPVRSPTLAAQMAAFKAKFPEARWHQYSPADRGNVREGARLAFGKPLNVVYAFDQADVIVSLDSDFLLDEPGSLRYSRQFIDRRRVRHDKKEMNRLYAIESTYTITGSMADHRLPVAPEAIQSIATALAAKLGVDGATLPADLPDDFKNQWLTAIVADLKKAGRRALVIAGEYQPPVVHALCHAINASLGASGNTVVYTDPIEANPVDGTASLRELVEDMNAGQVDLLLIVGGNPVYTSPADFEFKKALDKVALRAHLSHYEDETSFECHWHLPQTHELEEWNDLRAFDGTTSIVQPLIAPLYEGRSAPEVISILLGDPGRAGYEIVRSTWLQKHPGADFETFWQESLHSGVIAGTALPPIQPSLQQIAIALTSATTQPAAGGLRIVFRPDPSIGFGESTNNGWLQELPKPIIKLTWDNVVLLSFATAKRLGLEKESAVELRFRGRKINRAGVLPMPGMPDNVAVVQLGYGRTHSGKVGTGLGFNANAIRTSDAPWFGDGLEIAAVAGSYKLAITQEHQLMNGRDLVRVREIENYRHGAAGEGEHGGEGHGALAARKLSLNLYEPWDYSKGNSWGMVIDNNACIGCNACVIGCQAENNIPIVGKEQVINGRAMHWLRIDTYYASQGFETDDVPLDNPEVYFEPVVCMHCENAPCEVVCPVGATVHDAEGTNNMVYNRCVGTRYCSNNCAYKVRHFNYLSYNNDIGPTLRMQKNPDVTVRQRGVMEKCTYCIQRISHARIDAKKQDRPIRDGEVVTACQQACPTQAIIFGNLNDPSSQVKKLKSEPTNYGLLTELNTLPRTTYLERFRNPNPAIRG